MNQVKDLQYSWIDDMLNNLDGWGFKNLTELQIKSIKENMDCFLNNYNYFNYADTKIVSQDKCIDKIQSLINEIIKS